MSEATGFPHDEYPEENQRQVQRHSAVSSRRSAVEETGTEELDS